MSFYQEITPYYDQIFPINEKTERFLSICFKGKKSLLDVGAGTGNMALSLASKGFMVIATEPEEMMAKEIRRKGISGHVHLKVYTKTMEQINEFTETFDGIYCIGNTLAHLNSLEEISQFLHQSYQHLSEEGILIIQMVNFEKVLHNQDFSFPKIEKNTFTFERRYELKDENILFTTILTTNKESISNTISLFPATATQMIPLLNNCGFRDIAQYGNYEFGSYSINSPALILVAKK